MGGLTVDKLMVLAVIAVVIVGPDRLPHYAAQLGRLIKQLKGLVGEAKVRAVDEFGPDFDVDWKKLDPSQYDPRRIIREALLEDDDDSVVEIIDTFGAATPPKFTQLSLGGHVATPAQKSDSR